MRVSGAEPNHITFVSLFSSCADFLVHALSFGALVHGLVCKLDYDTDSVRVDTTISNMYCKCNRVDLALLCFQKMGYKNKVNWNTLVCRLMKNGEINRAVRVFDGMPERCYFVYIVN